MHIIFTLFLIFQVIDSESCKNNEIKTNYEGFEDELKILNTLGLPAEYVDFEDDLQKNDVENVDKNYFRIVFKFFILENIEWAQKNLNVSILKENIKDDRDKMLYMFIQVNSYISQKFPGDKLWSNKVMPLTLLPLDSYLKLFNQDIEKKHIKFCSKEKQIEFFNNIKFFDKTKYKDDDFWISSKEYPKDLKGMFEIMKKEY